MQNLLKDINNNYTLHNVLGNIPPLNFSNDKNICGECGHILKIEKVKPRKVYTVAYGQLKIRETIKKCPECDKKYGSEQLPQMVKKGSNYSYDHIVETGMLRYIEKRQISEIQAIFRNRNQLLISSTQIRRMAYNFLYYLGRLHYTSAGKISTAMQGQGGYILYVDSTCDGHAPHLLTCIDGVSGFVLYSQKIQSENTVSLVSALENVKKLFDNPLCCVSDMGRGINNALDIVFAGIIRIICHFHLLRDIGKDLMQELYRTVQKTLSNKQIYAEIRYQIQALEKIVGGKQQAEKLFYMVNRQENNTHGKLLQGLLYGYLLDLKSHENSGEGYGFPFDRPKVRYYKRILKIYYELVQIDAQPNFDNEVKKKNRFYKVKEVLQKIVEDEKLKLTVKELDKQIVYFDQLRHIMRIALPESKKGLNDEGKISSEKELKSIENEMTEYIETLKTKIENKSTENKKLQGVINQLEKYWDKIFANPITVMVEGKEKVIIPHRTNNTSEQFYRRIKQLFRRLHGRTNVSKDIDYLPDEIALIENLKNQHYKNTVMNAGNNLANEFARLDIENKAIDIEKDELDLKVSRKIIRFLKQFDPLSAIMKNFENVA